MCPSGTACVSNSAAGGSSTSVTDTSCVPTCDGDPSKCSSYSTNNEFTCQTYTDVTGRSVMICAL